MISTMSQPAKESEAKKMHDVNDHATLIVTLVKDLEGPIAAFPAAL